MFRSGNFDKLLDKATSHLMLEPDLVATLQICDLIRQGDVLPRNVLAALRKKLVSPNPHTALYALLVLESMVKNCGTIVHEELTTKIFCDFLHDLIKTTPHDKVRIKLLELIQSWNFAFRKNPKHGALKDLMSALKSEGYKFPTLRESDAMFAADTAPEWVSGDVCHRCRVPFNIIQRRHHCRACGQVFCAQCTTKTTTLPKYGIEKEVRVCDSCYDQATKPSAASKAALQKSETELPPEYLKSSLAQQNQDPPNKKSEDELREEEELQLALALSQSEAEAAKENEKFKVSSTIHTFKSEPVERAVTPKEEFTNPELKRYLDRSYWESVQSKDQPDQKAQTSPSAPATAPSQSNEIKYKSKENGVAENDLEDFISTLKSQVEIFINRMKSDSSRGRCIANDTSVQTLFMNITAMHSRLLRHIQEHDDGRIHFERLQDKLTQVKDARAALDALREEHREKLRREAEEAERQRQMQMALKLEVMRKKKQEYLQYQRQLALQRIQEQEREMQMRQEQQKQQYMMPQYGYMGSPVHGQPFPPNAAPPMPGYNPYPYPQHMMPPQQQQQGPPPQMGGQQPQIPGQPPQMGGQQAPMGGPQPQMGSQQPQMGGPQHGPLPPQSMPHNPQQLGPPPGFPPVPSSQPVPAPNATVPVPQPGNFAPHGVPSQPMIANVGIPQTGVASNVPAMPQNQGGVSQAGMPPNHGGAMLPLHFQQAGAPPASPQQKEAQTAELISFD